MTYGYYPGVTDSSPMSNYVLSTSDLGKTFRVYTDGRNNVLGAVPVSAAAGVGVVTKATAVQLDTATASGLDYAVKYTILKPDNTYVEITGIQSATPTYWDATTIAAPLGYVRELVSWTYSGIGDYYIVTPAAAAVVNNQGSVASNTVFAGVADTLGGPNGSIMDDDTVIFVANYAMNNSLASTPTVGAFALTGYSIYNGIKDLPNDLAAAPYPAELYDNGIRITGVGSQNSFSHSVNQMV